MDRFGERTFCCQFILFLRSYGVSLDFLPERMVKAENLEQEILSWRWSKLFYAIFLYWRIPQSCLSCLSSPKTSQCVVFRDVVHLCTTHLNVRLHGDLGLLKPCYQGVHSAVAVSKYCFEKCRFNIKTSQKAVFKEKRFSTLVVLTVFFIAFLSVTYGLSV